MAIRIERQGIDFYEKCAEVTQDSRIRDVFHFLIEQEWNHVRVFSDMRRGLEDYVLPESYPGETLGYLDSFVRDRVFSGPERAVEQGRTISDPFAAVDLALELEKSSILFYSGMKQVVRPSEHDAIDRVIGEEHDHIRRLLALRRALE